MGCYHASGVSCQPGQVALGGHACRSASPQRFGKAGTADGGAVAESGYV
jgi:hypothetical protein